MISFSNFVSAQRVNDLSTLIQTHRRISAKVKATAFGHLRDKSSTVLASQIPKRRQKISKRARRAKQRGAK